MSLIEPARYSMVLGDCGIFLRTMFVFRSLFSVVNLARGNKVGLNVVALLSIVEERQAKAARLVDNYLSPLPVS